MAQISGHPTSYDEGYQAYSFTSPANGYADSNSANNATIELTRGAQAITEVFYNFSLSIPADATINSVSCSVKCSITSTNSTFIRTRTVQLYSGATAKGSAHNVVNNTTVFNMDVGTWTVAELNNAKIRIYGKRNNGNVDRSYKFSFYGATLTIDYTGTSSSVPIKVKSNGTWVEPQKIYAKSGGTWHLAQSIYVNVGGGWIPNSVDPTGHSIWVDDYPWDESNPQDPYNNGWAESFYEYASMGEYFNLDQRGSPTGTKYNYVGPMEFNGKIIFLWQAAPDSPGGAPDPSTIKYAATTTNDINLLRSMSVCNYTSSEDMVAAISPGGSALNKIMLLSEDAGIYDNFSDVLGGEVLFKVE